MPQTREAGSPRASSGMIACVLVAQNTRTNFARTAETAPVARGRPLNAALLIDLRRADLGAVRGSEGGA